MDPGSLLGGKLTHWSLSSSAAPPTQVKSPWHDTSPWHVETCSHAGACPRATTLHKTAATYGRISESTAAFVARVQEEKSGPTKDSFVTLVRGIRFVKSTKLSGSDQSHGSNHRFTHDRAIAQKTDASCLSLRAAALMPPGLLNATGR